MTRQEILPQGLRWRGMAAYFGPDGQTARIN